MSLKNILAKKFSSPNKSSFNVKKLFSEFGKDKTENRLIDDNLKHGISLFESGEREKASKVFLEVIENRSDHISGYIWYAEFLKSNKEFNKAIEILKNGAKKCRKKSELLQFAGEIAILDCVEIRRAFHLLAQSIAALPDKSSTYAQTAERAILFMKEIFDFFDDSVGVKWVENRQSDTTFDKGLLSKIHYSLNSSPSEDRSHILQELPNIREYLIKKFK